MKNQNFMKRFIVFFCVATLVFSLAGCSEEAINRSETPSFERDVYVIDF